VKTEGKMKQRQYTGKENTCISIFMMRKCICSWQGYLFITVDTGVHLFTQQNKIA